jgi:hypothetical protein
MKKLAILLVLSTVLSHTAWAQLAQSNLGLISQLVEVKHEAEQIVSKVLADTSGMKKGPIKTQESENKVLNKYNELRMQVDAVVLQLAADMQVEGSVRLFKKLNKYYSNHLLMDGDPQGRNLSKYGPAFRKIYLLKAELQQSTKQWVLAVKNKNAAPIDSIAGANMGVDGVSAAVLPVIELSWTIIKEWQAANQSKVEGIVALLDRLRLTAPHELVKKPDEKKEK